MNSQLFVLHLSSLFSRIVAPKVSYLKAFKILFYVEIVGLRKQCKFGYRMCSCGIFLQSFKVGRKIYLKKYQGQNAG